MALQNFSICVSHRAPITFKFVRKVFKMKITDKKDELIIKDNEKSVKNKRFAWLEKRSA